MPKNKKLEVLTILYCSGSPTTESNWYSPFMKCYSFASFSFPILLTLITFALPIQTFSFCFSVGQSQLLVLYFFPSLVLPRSRPDSSIISIEASNVSQSASRDVMSKNHCGLLPKEISVQYVLHPTQKFPPIHLCRVKAF